MSNCRKCGREFPDGAPFCCWCGVRQTREEHQNANGEGTAYKRGSTWTVKVRVWQPEYRCLTKGGFRSKKEALAAAADLRASLLNRPATVQSFAGLWELFKNTTRFQELSEGKKGAYGIAYKKCVPLHAVKDVSTIRYRDVQPLVDGLTFYPARDIKVLLNGLFEMAVKNEWMRENPAALIELPHLEKHDKVVFSDDEIEKLRAVDDSMARLILLGILTGMRPIELRSVTDECIRLADHCIVGAGAKTELGKAVPIMLSNEAEQVCAELMGHIPTFSGDDAFYSQFYATLEKAGISNPGHRLTPNSMRHTFITRLTVAGVPPAVIQKAARHTSYTTTLGYTHPDMSDVLAAVNKLSPSRP